MSANIIRGPRRSQDFASLESIISTDNDVIGSMDGNLKRDANRLVQTRLALGFAKQKEFCDQIGVGQSTWNAFEKGQRPITLAVARKMKRRFGIPLDWTLDNDPSNLPAKLYRKLIPDIAI